MKIDYASAKSLRSDTFFRSVSFSFSGKFNVYFFRYYIIIFGVVLLALGKRMVIWLTQAQIIVKHHKTWIMCLIRGVHCLQCCEVSICVCNSPRMIAPTEILLFLLGLKLMGPIPDILRPRHVSQSRKNFGLHSYCCFNVALRPVREFVPRPFGWCQSNENIKQVVSL